MKTINITLLFCFLTLAGMSARAAVSLDAGWLAQSEYCPVVVANDDKKKEAEAEEEPDCE